MATQMLPNPQLDRLQAWLDDRLDGRPGLRVLDAGCGRYCRVRAGRDPYVVGIDSSTVQLELNEDLQERLEGDVQTATFPPGSFDAIVCWNVLEHLPQPDQALANFEAWTRPGGLIILAVPNVWSLKGLFTKFTPHRFHVWFWRNILGRPNAGQPGRFPFPTFLRLSISPGRLSRFASERGLTIEYFELYESVQQEVVRRRFRVLGPLWTVVRVLTSALTLGRVSADRTDIIAVFAKPSGSGGPPAADPWPPQA